MTHRNLTTAKTRYPGGSYYRGEVYYVEHMAEQADQERKRRKVRKDDITMTSPKEWNSLGSTFPEQRRCTSCNEPFTPANTRQKTCLDPECRRERNRELQRIKDAKRARPLAARECVICGEEYTPIRSTQKTCSEEHGAQYQKQRQQEYRELRKEGAA